MPTNNLQKLLDAKYPINEWSPTQSMKAKMLRTAFTEGYNAAIIAIGKFNQTNGKDATSFFDLLTKFVNQ